MDEFPACSVWKGDPSLEGQQIDNGRDDGRHDDHGQLKPVEEGDANELWLHKVIEGRPEQDTKGNE